MITRYIYRALRYIYNKTTNNISNIYTKFLLKINQVHYEAELTSNGIPFISIHHSASVVIKKKFTMNNTINSNPIGRSQKCLLIVRENAKLTIGNNVGISGTTLVSHKEITIKDNVKIGGNVCIYDTDFHSLSFSERINGTSDRLNTIKKEVLIDENVFIGAHSTILKGVSIGKNSIIGAGSVVATNVPDNEIWAGNPAKLIRKIHN